LPVGNSLALGWRAYREMEGGAVAETVMGCVTMVSHGTRSTGVWVLVNRRTRVYLPQAVAVVAVGDCVTVSGWREEDRNSWFLMAQPSRRH
jgi:hypothetical protein